MGKKVLKFTNKTNGIVKELQYGALGHEVFDVTKSINEMNDAIRWCNNHKEGDVFDCDAYKIEIIG